MGGEEHKRPEASKPQATVSSRQEVASGQWTCAACTFINKNKPDECQMCQQKRPRNPPMQSKPQEQAPSPKPDDSKHEVSLDDLFMITREINRLTDLADEL